MSLAENADKLLLLLKGKGPQSVASLTPMLNMTKMGARQHLLSLEEQDLVTSDEHASGVGRPQRVWRLTEKAAQRFPNSHAFLTVELLESMKNLFGEEGMERVISSREKVMLQKYQAALQNSKRLGDKIKKLVKIRSAEGYMAECQRNKDGSYLLIENHCPICAAATECQLFCRSELQLFQTVLGNKVQVQRESHILAGARRCTYSIRNLPEN